jgi:hypothetical protein
MDMLVHFASIPGLIPLLSLNFKPITICNNWKIPPWNDTNSPLNLESRLQALRPALEALSEAGLAPTLHTGNLPPQQYQQAWREELAARGTPWHAWRRALARLCMLCGHWALQGTCTRVRLVCRRKIRSSACCDVGTGRCRAPAPG